MPPMLFRFLLHRSWKTGDKRTLFAPSFDPAVTTRPTLYRFQRERAADEEGYAWQNSSTPASRRADSANKRSTNGWIKKRG